MTFTINTLLRLSVRDLFMFKITYGYKDGTERGLKDGKCKKK